MRNASGDFDLPGGRRRVALRPPWPCRRRRPRYGTPPPPTSPPARTSPATAPGILAAPWRAGQVKSFNDYLTTYQVAGIVPTWQLFRTATAWKDCGGQPFEIPPTSEWPHIVQTLRYIHDYVIPAVGPVEPVSGYRNPSLNHCAGGAPESAHKHYSAIDMVPLRPITREQLMTSLCASHSQHGAPYNAGLGFYAFCAFTSTAPNSAAGTWTRRSPRFARRSSTRKMSPTSASRFRLAAPATPHAGRANPNPPQPSVPQR